MIISKKIGKQTLCFLITFNIRRFRFGWYYQNWGVDNFTTEIDLAFWQVAIYKHKTYSDKYIEEGE